MNTIKQQPQDKSAWHKAPTPDVTCSICGLSRKFYFPDRAHGTAGYKAHRSRRTTDPPAVQWLVRVRLDSVRAIKREDGELVEELLTPEDAKERIRQVAARVLLGIPRQEIARALGIRPDTLGDLLRKYPATLEAALVEVRAQGVAGVLQPVEKKPRIPPYVRRLVGQAVALVAGGKTAEQVTAALDLPPGTIPEWRLRYAVFWRQELSRAREVSRQLYDQLAGTAAALDNPAGIMALARGAARGSPSLAPADRRRGRVVVEELSASMTLCQFFRSYYLPARLKDAAPQTVCTYNVAIKKWKAFTGDPALRDITVNTLMRFRDGVERLPGQGGARRSTWAIAQAIKHVQYVLDRAGPPAPRRRDCLGLLSQVPYLRPPQILQQLPCPVPNDVLDRLYRVAEAMDRPRIPGLAPTAWWHCLLVVALNCGLRSETLFLFRWEHVYLDEARLAIPAEFLKTRKPIILPLSAVAISHLESIRGHAERVFPWPHGRSKFYIDWHRLQDAAGITRPGHYKLKQVRKSLASLLWESDPAAAQLFLGHTTDATTKKYYVSRHILDRAMRALPQPAAFLEPIGGSAT